MTRGRHLLLAGLLAFAWPLAAGDAGCDDASDFRPVDELGLACRTANGWLVRIDESTTLFTHGLDPHPPHANETASGAFAPPIEPYCVTNPASAYHMQVLYTRPSNKPDNYAAMAPAIRRMVREVNGYLRSEALEAAGVWATYRVACANGDIDVRNVVLNTPSNRDSFGSIVAELSGKGFSSPFAKYWIWHDDAGEAAGVANIWFNDSPGVNNPNNGGPMYAVTFASDAFVMMHENGHNLGAVQLSAPFSSRFGHCVDGSDVMCYIDPPAGTAAPAPPVCLGQHFDCNHNDYFHPSPAPGSYLALRWNIGSRVNRFIEFSDEAGLPSAPAAAASSTGPSSAQITWTAPSNPGSSAITEYRVYKAFLGARMELLATLPATTFEYEATGLSGGSYVFRVSAMNALGEGNPSAEARAASARPPQPPAALVVVAGPAPDQVTLQWAPPVSDEGSPVTNYRVYRAPDFRFPVFIGDAGTATTYVDAPGLGFWQYRVSAVSAAGESFKSVPAWAPSA